MSQNPRTFLGKINYLIDRHGSNELVVIKLSRTTHDLREERREVAVKLDDTLPFVRLASGEQLFRMLTLEGRRCDVVLARTEERFLMPALVLLEE